MARRVSEKQLNVTSYDEERSLPQVNECAFDSGLIEKKMVQILTWISLDGFSLGKVYIFSLPRHRMFQAGRSTVTSTVIFFTSIHR